jgi:hypothetical protein
MADGDERIVREGSTSGLQDLLVGRDRSIARLYESLAVLDFTFEDYLNDPDRRKKFSDGLGVVVKTVSIPTAPEQFAAKHPQFSIALAFLQITSALLPDTNTPEASLNPR